MTQTYEALSSSDAGRVLVVDDEPSVRRSLRRMLERAGHDVLEAGSVETARQVLDAGGVDVVVLDVGLPDQSGLSLLRHARLLARPVSVVIFTGSDDRRDMSNALASGAVSYLRKSADELTIEAQIEIALRQVRNLRASEAGRLQLEGTMVEMLSRMEALPRKLAEGLCSAWDLRHIETGAHVRRIGAFSEVLAVALGLSLKDAKQLHDAAMLHDVGKIVIPDAILAKPSALTPDEFEIMKRHTVEGARMLGPIRHPFFQAAAMIALRHHERWDGSGYPDGLREDECPRDARIVAIVDVYDALGQPRCYKPAWTEQQVLAFFREHRGTQFEAEMVDALLDSVPQLKELAREIAEVAAVLDSELGQR